MRISKTINLGDATVIVQEITPEILINLISQNKGMDWLNIQGLQDIGKFKSLLSLLGDSIQSDIDIMSLGLTDALDIFNAFVEVNAAFFTLLATAKPATVSPIPHDSSSNSTAPVADSSSTVTSMPIGMAGDSSNPHA